MAVLKANIGVFNWFVDSPKLQNVYMNMHFILTRTVKTYKFNSSLYFTYQYADTPPMPSAACQ